MAVEVSHKFLSFSKRLFLYVLTLFLGFVICFVVFQYKREKSYKIDLLNTQLQNYNDRINDLIFADDSIDEAKINNFIKHCNQKDLRVTLIAKNGKVIFDNYKHNLEEFNNHLSRKEIIDALKSGTGYSINRRSQTFGKEYFYSAKFYPHNNYIIRSAMPYNMNLVEHLQADIHFIWFTIAISLILIIFFYKFTNKLSMSIDRLQLFAVKADKNEPIDMSIQEAFPNNELGEISKHIIKIYKRLRNTKEDLYIEREKLITHLRISHEGLGVFKSNRDEIIVNNLFIHYINIISDSNLSNTKDFFSVPEIKPIVKFIEKNQQLTRVTEERRFSLNIEKSGRIFSIECIIFQDNSFEININDITQDEQQARLKKQLTQNIAHELKTPVSSIQGYLETIISNPDISKEKLFEFLTRSYAQSNRLTHLLQDISVLTRMEEAPSMIEKDKINLSDMVKSIMSELYLDLDNKHMKVDNDLPDNLHIYGNSSLIYSIFRNLFDNAIAYAGTYTTITIKKFREDDNSYYFSFADNGVGVSEEHLNRIFERFYRVDKGRSRKLGGTGLGLAIVKNAVIHHGGTIVAKKSPSCGIEFIFTLSKN